MSTIKKSLRSGVAITFVTRYTRIFIQILIGAILARILNPEEFGIVAIVSVFVTFFGLLSQMGLSQAIVQKKNLDEKDISNLFYFSVFIAAVLGVVFYFSAEFIAAFFKRVVYVEIVRLLSIAVFFGALNIVPNGVLLKKRNFKTIGLIEIVVQITTGAGAIYMALDGHSYFSLIYRSIFECIGVFFLSMFFARIKLFLTFSMQSIKKVFTYSGFQFLFSFVNYFARNLDNILIGKYLGEFQLGFYDKAYRLMLYPVRNFTWVITPVLHPVLSDYQNDKKFIYDTYLKLIRILALIGVPISIFLYFSAKEVIILLYGDQWLSTVPIFQIMAFSIWVQIIVSSSGAIFQASGSTKGLFFTSLINTFVLIVAMFVGIPYGVEGVALAVVGAIYFNFVPTYYMLIKKVLKQPLIPLFNSLLKPFLLGIIVIIGLYSVSLYCNDLPLLLSFGFKLAAWTAISFIGLIVTKQLDILKNIMK